MKNLSLILNIVLFIAVGILYYFYFSGSGSSTGNSNITGGVPLGEIKMAFVNSDSVLKHYEYVTAKGEVLEAKSKRLEQDYRKRAESLQSEFNAYQRNANSMTIGQVRAVEEDLTKKQQNLQMFEQSITQELMNDQSKLNEDLYKRITAFLKEYGSKNGLQVVFKYDVSSDLLYGGEVLDITRDVIDGLNKEYQVEKTGGQVKSDTTSQK